MDKRSLRFSAKTIILLIVVGAITGCSGTQTRAPITDAEAIPSHKIQTHIVAKGETLYSIAWRYNLDYQGLARANGLDKHYNIWPGQTLRLEAKPKSSSPQTASKGGSKGTWQSVKSSLSRLVKSSPSPAAPTSSQAQVAAIPWQWPASGDLITTFDQGTGLNKGIDIRGKLGEPVIAAAPGVVVYAGSGLRGYGKLLIVKHSEKVLSAYAHNRVLHVAEGDQVTRGQKIAQVGASGTDTAKLHFEIRYDGKPVNPLAYLPKR